MRFHSVDILDTDHPIDDQIAEFVDSEALAALLGAFALTMPGGQLRDRLGWLDAASEIWDFRRGAERNRARSVELGASVSETVHAAADALGMVHSRSPRRRRYDHVLILGGLVRACFSRPAAAAQLLAGGGVSARTVTALGGFRPLGGDEFALASALGHPHLTDEFDAMEVGVRSAFGLQRAALNDDGDDPGTVGGAWRVRDLRSSDGVAIRVVAAPSTEPNLRRANTADTYRWFAERLEEVGDRTNLLLVTSAIYVPFQHADAIRMLHLRYGAHIDTVGVTTSELPPPLGQDFGAHHYLQEVRSTIRAYRLLLEALPS